MLEIYFNELFSNITNPKACFQASKIRLPFFFISIPTIKELACLMKLAYLMIYIYIYILYFAWADQRDKVCFIFHKVQGCCMEKKHSYEVNLLLFLLYSAFQKVIIAFLHTSIALDSRLYERSRVCTFFNGNDNLVLSSSTSCSTA